MKPLETSMGSTTKQLIPILAAAILAFLLAVIMVGLQPVVRSGGGNAQIAYAQDVSMKYSTPLTKAPISWKKTLSASYYGHTSRAYHTDFVFTDKSGTWYMPYRIDGMVAQGKIRGKTKCKYLGVQENGLLAWSVTRGKAAAYATARNVVLDIWDSAHGQGDFRFSKAESKRLLKTATNGKVKYAALVKWPRSKAQKKGVSVERQYLTKHFAKNIKPI